jgi:hypothetical protein
MPNSIKEWAMLVAKVGAAYAVIYAIQKKGMAIPVIGGYLPGGQ